MAEFDNRENPAAANGRVSTDDGSPSMRASVLSESPLDLPVEDFHVSANAAMERLQNAKPAGLDYGSPEGARKDPALMNMADELIAAIGTGQGDLASNHWQPNPSAALGILGKIETTSEARRSAFEEKVMEKVRELGGAGDAKDYTAFLEKALHPLQRNVLEGIKKNLPSADPAGFAQRIFDYVFCEEVKKQNPGYINASVPAGAVPGGSELIMNAVLSLDQEGLVSLNAHAASALNMAEDKLPLFNILKRKLNANEYEIVIKRLNDRGILKGESFNSQQEETKTEKK